MQHSCEDHKENESRSILEGYREKASDLQSELDALERCEALISDAMPDGDAEGSMLSR